jgi:MoaA/NifB/PqqE/SkfB family radical SAM enzyme
MEEEHFRFDLNIADAQELFKRHVEQVEFETTSYCNRTCSFCPNSFIDRLSEKRAMPDATWQAIIAGLRAINFTGSVIWSRYCEPLSERDIVDRVRQVRNAAPLARICIFSNGDYLDAEYLRDLEEAGLNYLWVDVYFPDDETYDNETAIQFHDKFLKRIGRSATLYANDTELCYKVESELAEIVTHVRNMAAMKAMNLSDRGGLIHIASKTKRVAPCYMPYKNLIIDWDGSVVICCHLRSDSLSHRSAVVGKIGEAGLGLVEAYIRLAGWRRALRGYGQKKGPCATCNVSEYDSTLLTRALSGWLTNTRSPLRAIMKTAMRPVLKRRVRY